MPTITRKIQIIPIGNKEEVNRVYTYIRDGMFNQNKAMNQYMSALYTSIMLEASKEDRQELNRLYSRISTSAKGSAYGKEDIVFPKGLPTTACLAQKVRQDMQKSVKEGLLYGKVSLPTYRKDNPLLVHVDYIRLRNANPHQDRGLYHEYKTHEEFLEELHKGYPDIYIKFANNITFKLKFGNPYKSREMRSAFQNIFEENYQVQGSSIQFDRTGKKIILNLCLSIPKKDAKLKEDTVIGVYFGVTAPLAVALNNNSREEQVIGNKGDFLRLRAQIQAQRRRLQKDLNSASGGHGRGKKLKALDRLSEREKNFVQTYNHYMSKHIVDFAVKNNAKYINMEAITKPRKKLDEETRKDIVLHNCSIYQLQQYITYKATLYGIEARKVKEFEDCPDEETRIFDYARNVAFSEDFVKGNGDDDEAEEVV